MSNINFNTNEHRRNFFEALFEPELSDFNLFIEVRPIRLAPDRDDGKRRPDAKTRRFCESVDEAIAHIDAIKNDPDLEVFFGVCPRDNNQSGEKKDIPFVKALYVDIDFGKIGHKKESAHKTAEEAWTAIKDFQIKPSAVIRSSENGGFHVYYFLKKPLDDTNEAERCLSKLADRLGGDTAVDVARILRPPLTYNHKLKDNQRPCSLVFIKEDRVYELSDFDFLFKEDGKGSGRSEQSGDGVDIHNLGLKKKWVKMIVSGKFDKDIYESRSERDAAVIVQLIGKGLSDEQIIEVFQRHPDGVGDKAAEKKDDQYIDRSMRRAREKYQADRKVEAEKGFDSGSYVDILLEKRDLKFKVGLGFYEWTDKRYYRSISDTHVMADIDRLGEGLDRRRRGEIFEKLKLDHRVLLDEGMDFNQNLSLLNLKNGMFDTEEFVLRPHEEIYLSTIPLNFAYEPDAEASIWDKFIHQVLDDEDDIANIQKMMGYCLTAETRAEAMFILHGNGSNGKSVICNQLNYMAGEENVSAVQLHEFDQRFKRAAIYGKLINISTDIDDRNLSSTGLVKAIISGEPIDAEFKNKDSFSFRPFCKVVIGANHLPRVRDNSAGLFRRVIIFDFKHVFEGKEKDTSLGAKLRMETDGIFNWVLEGLKMLRENDFKFTLSRENKEMLNKLRTFNNPVKAFVDELCVVKPELVCEKKVVYGKYKQWCVRTNHAPKAENSFFEDLYRAFPEIEQTRPSKNGNRLMMLKGICLEDNYEYDDSDDKVIEMDKHRESRDSGADEPLSVDLDDDEIYFLDEV